MSPTEILLRGGMLAVGTVVLVAPILELRYRLRRRAWDLPPRSDTVGSSVSVESAVVDSTGAEVVPGDNLSGDTATDPSNRVDPGGSR